MPTPCSSPTVSRWGLLVLTLLLITPALQAQTAAIRGFITDGSDGQPLQGVNVVLNGEAEAFLGAVTDADGFYILPRIPVGTYQLQASYIGYQTYVDTLALADGDSRSINLVLNPGDAELDEVVVEGERETGAASLTAGLQTIRPKDIDLVPSPDVSGDLATYLTAMPGVVSLGDRGGQLFVRGGEPSHNQTLLDGMYVYQPFHILGFYSTFASDILRNADVHTGGFSSKFSGRISSVIDVHTRNGNKKEYRRILTLAPFVNMAMLEGPLKRDKMSFLAMTRQSVIDKIASRYVADPLPYRFGDFFGKVHAVLTPSHQVSITALRTYDRGALEDVEAVPAAEEIRWANTAYGIRYLIVPKNLPILAEVLFSVSTLETETGLSNAPSRTSSIGGFNTSVNFTNFGHRSQVQWGFFLRSPELQAELGGAYQNLDVNKERFTNAGFYFEPEIILRGGLRVRPGVVGQLAGEQGFFLEPRLRMVMERGPHEFSAATGLYRQDVVGISDRRDATNVFTAYAETPLGKSTTAIHGLLGYRVRPRPGIEVSAETYYKRIDNLFIAEWTAYPRFTSRLQEADGRVMGLDLRLEVQRERFYGFLNYGLSSVEYTALQENLQYIYGSARFTFRPPHDRRHQVNAMARVRVRKMDLSFRWNYGSGLPFSQVRGFDGFILLDGPVDVEAERGISRVIYDRPFAGLLPAYHRLDVNLERVFQYKDDSFVTLQGGIINVYNQTNLFALDVFTLRRNNQLPFVPTLGVKFDF